MEKNYWELFVKTGHPVWYALYTRERAKNGKDQRDSSEIDGLQRG